MLRQMLAGLWRISCGASEKLRGRTAPPINIEKGMIVDGNHRYVAHLICKKKCPTQDLFGGRPDWKVHWDKIRLEPIVWPE